MNWKLLGTMVTLIGVGASVALGQGTTPTIVQGDYISNVFGNSNFIKNPNAKLNNANVTVSNATVTRSTTTPLVATSEFNITTSTSTGYADWSTRTFDAGMKNQNCEARFSYRGFSVGSTTAQILQGANVVAQLTLTASTDPRIASINFPCGDLSSATTFRLQQATASLTGTNEIGGIYIGLATNMANVAQAEFVGSLSYQAGGSCQWSRVGDGTFANFAADSDCVVQQTTGVCNDSAGKIPGMTCNLTKPGRYEVIVQQRSRMNGRSDMTTLFRIHDGTTGGPTSLMYQIPNITSYESIQTQTLTASYEYTSAGTKTFQVQSNTGVTNTALIYGNETTPVWEMKVYRFPSSSELVVTPERQSWYISGYHNGALPDLGNANQVSRTEITNGSLTFVPDAGSQPVATLCASGNNPPALSTTSTTCAAGSESVGLTFNIPSVGSYEVCSQFSSNVATAAASSIDMGFSLEETTTTSSTPLTGNKSNARYATVDTSGSNTAMPFRHCQIMTFNSIGQKAVRLMYRQAVTGTINQNYILADDARGRAVIWSVKPVTNQSNSALYVEGPVKASATGAAIPAGYVGEVKRVSSTGFIAAGASGVFKTVVSLALEAGVWMCQQATTTACPALNCQDAFTGLSGTNNGALNTADGDTLGIYAFQTGWNFISGGTTMQTIRSTGSSLIFPDGSTSGSNILYSNTRVAYPSGSPTLYSRLMCTRIN